MTYSARSRSSVTRFAVFGVGGFFLPSIRFLLRLRALALGRGFAVELRQLLDQRALFFRDLLRNVHANGREQIAAAALRLRDAASTNAEHLARFGAGRDLHRDRFLERRHRDLRAEDRFRERHRHVDREIRVVASEDRVLLDADEDVQVTGLTARYGAAAAANADARAVADTGRDLHFHVLGLVLDAGAVAHRAGVLDLTATPAARRAGAREREHPLALLHGAGSAARRACVRPTGTVARTTAGGARCVARDADGNGDAARRIFERDTHRGFEVGAALWCARASTAAAAAAEDAAEQIAEVERNAFLETDVLPSAAAAAGRVARSRHASYLVVLLALLRVG